MGGQQRVARLIISIVYYDALRQPRNISSRGQPFPLKFFSYATNSVVRKNYIVER